MARNEYTLKEAINELIKSYKLKGKFDQTKIVNHWEQWMGKTIARHTRNIYIKERKLFVTIDSAPLKQELSYMKERIVETVNENAGENLIDAVVIW